MTSELFYKAYELIDSEEYGDNRNVNCHSFAYCMIMKAMNPEFSAAESKVFGWELELERLLEANQHRKVDSYVTALNFLPTNLISYHIGGENRIEFYAWPG